jgi:murein L,D-transpeptidase YcbB/YkuD
MEGSYEGSHSWFDNPDASASSHFLTARDGRLAQAVDTKDRAWAQAAGNRTWISVENEGKVPQALTKEQLEKVAQTFAWVVRTHKDVPYQVSNSPTVKGLGYHRMGGAAWGGHSCPGDAIIAQLQSIVDRAKTINGVGVKPTPHYAPYPGDKYFFIGRTSKLVTELGKALVKAGYKGYKQGPGPIFSPADRKAVKWFQQKQGWSGEDANGTPGPETWKRLKVAPPKS